MGRGALPSHQQLMSGVWWPQPISAGVQGRGHRLIQPMPQGPLALNGEGLTTFPEMQQEQRLLEGVQAPVFQPSRSGPCLAVTRL